MEYMGFEEIVSAVDGKIILKKNYDSFNEVCTDTRKIKEGNIFIALKGENFNGNKFTVEASKKGALLCIIDEISFKEEELDSKTSVILVKDTKKALLKLAEHYRSKLKLKVIGITGSTGKTSTKDLVAAALSSKYKVYKTQGNFNNEIGLPLTIFNIDKSIEVAVLEMGMSNFNEIHNMAEVAKPDIAIITNIGLSHIENLKTRENILKAKLEITDFFNNKNTLIVNADNDLLKNFATKDFNIIKTGIEEDIPLNLHAIDINLHEESVDFNIAIDNNQYEKFSINIPGKHTVQNSMLAIACARIIGLTFKEIKEGLSNLETTSMRMDIIKNDRCTIINDCYNASPDSMKAAIDVLCNMKCNRRIAVLGTMKELGHKSYEAHEEVLNYAVSKGIDYVITIGEFNKIIDDKNFCKNDKTTFKAFEDYNYATRFLLDILNHNDVVLIKASRSMKFENIVKEIA